MKYILIGLVKSNLASCIPNTMHAILRMNICLVSIQKIRYEFDSNYYKFVFMCDRNICSW